MRLAINQLRTILSRKDKVHFTVLLGYTLVYAVIETIGIGLILPFLSLLDQFERIHTYGPITTLYVYLGAPSKTVTIISLGGLLACFYACRAGMILHYAYATSKFVQGRYHSLAYRLFNHYLTLRYTDYQTQHSGNLSRAIITEATQLSALIQQHLVLVSEGLVLLCIYGLLLAMNWSITLILSLYTGLIGIILVKIITTQTTRAGKQRHHYHTRFYRTITETFSNFKLIKLLPDHRFLKTFFHDSSYQLSKTQITHQVLAQLPRTILEGSGLVMMLGLVMVAAYQRVDLMALAPLLALYALAFFRLMPAVNRLLSAYNSITFYKPSLGTVHHHLTLDTEGLGSHSIVFQKQMALQSISFAYPNAPDKPVLTNLSLTIAHGQKIGIMGSSGAGKSTLLDMVCGLIEPTTGQILIDETPLTPDTFLAWRATIGYVTQDTTLFDNTVAYNIAFGHPMDTARVITVLKQVQLYDFFCRHEGLDTVLGENGCRLSGGQRQRIGVARALYHDPALLILDEATSALDKATENHLIDDVFATLTGRTVISVSHHKAALRYCDTLIKLNDQQHTASAH